MVQRLVVKKDTIWELGKGSIGFSFQMPLPKTDLHVLTYETFKSDIFRLFSGLTKARQFVDVGVNIGQTMLEVMSLNNELDYFGFEPNIEALSCAKSLAMSNNFEVNLFPWACSAKSSPLEIYMESTSDSSATIDKSIRPNTYNKIKPIPIASYPLDQTFCSLSQHGFMLKIDVEGSENEVFLGALRLLKEKRPLVLCEVLHAHRATEIDLNNSRKVALREFLTELNYDLFLINLSTSDREKFLGIQKIDHFPLNQLWRDSPHTCDYIFLPRELGLIYDKM